MRKLTAIYVDSWFWSAHLHSITRMMRIEVEENDMDIKKILKDKGIDDKIVFLFEGWPKIVGEENE